MLGVTTAGDGLLRFNSWSLVKEAGVASEPTLSRSKLLLADGARFRMTRIWGNETLELLLGAVMRVQSNKID